MDYQLFPGDELVVEVTEGEVLVARRQGSEFLPVPLDGPLMVMMRLPSLSKGLTQRAGADDPYLGAVQLRWPRLEIILLVDQISYPGNRGIRVVGLVTDVSYQSARPMLGDLPFLSPPGLDA